MSQGQVNWSSAGTMTPVMSGRIHSSLIIHTHADNSGRLVQTVVSFQCTAVSGTHCYLHRVGPVVQCAAFTDAENDSCSITNPE